MEEKKRKHVEVSADPKETKEQSQTKSKKKKKKLDEESMKPSLSYDLKELFSIGGKRTGGSHLHFTDIRTLIMLTVHGERFPCLPTWCSLNNWRNIKKTVVVLVSGVSSLDYEKHKEHFKHLNSYFGTPGIPLHNEGNHMLKSPLQSFLFYRMPKKLQIEKRQQKATEIVLRNYCDLVLTDTELKNNEFPEWNSSAKEHGVITTRNGNDTVIQRADKDSEVYAVDCEMCNARNERVLTRVTVVNKDLEIVYDELVKPHEEITDYLTEYSGITAAMLENVTTRLKDVQKFLLKLIKPDTILIGHSLDFDFRALKLHHDNVIDTSLLYVDHRGPRFKSSLKFLAKTFLHRDIQNSSEGHCSAEDAKACMELVNLKMEKGKTFGDPNMEQESVYEALHRAGKKGALLEDAAIIRQHVLCHQGIPCSTDEEVVKKSRKCISKCDFTFAHIKSFKNYLQAMEVNNEEGPNESFHKEILSKVDGYVGEILSHVPSETLVVLSLSSGYLSNHITQLLKDKNERKNEIVKTALYNAKNGLCFVKIT